MILVIDTERGFHARVVRALPGQSDIGHRDDLEGTETELALADPPVEVLVVGPSVPVSDACDLATWLHRRGAATSVVLAVRDPSADLLRQALRAGVGDVIDVAADDDALTEAIDRLTAVNQQLRSTTNGSEPASPHSKVVTVFSTKGGCGKSFLATNLGLILRRRTGAEVAIVDLDLQSGDVAIMLQLLPSWTIYDAAENLDRLDEEALAGYLTPHRSGLHLLAAPLEPALADTVSQAAVERILSLLRHRFPYILVDSPGFFTDQVLAALDATDEVVLVASMDVPSIKNLKLSLNTLAQLGIDRDRVQVVLNRADSKVGLRMPEVEKSLGTTIDVAIPSTREIPLSVNQGIPLAESHKRSPAVSAVRRLAERIRIPSAPPVGSRFRPFTARS